jgi:hypothetical protein
MNARPARWKSGLVVLVVAALLPLLLAAVTPSNRTFDLEEARAVERTATALVAGGAPGNRQGVYARAFAAYGLVNVQLLGAGPVDASSYDALVEQVASPAASSAFPGRVQLAGHRIATSVALRGHLALMLEARDRLGPPPVELRSFRDALTLALAKEVLAARGHLLTTGPGVVYPADNEVLLAALTLGARRGEPTVLAAARALRSALDALSIHGAAPSRLAAGSLSPTDVPRGCALGYSALFRALVGDPQAKALYAGFRAGFFAERGPLVGFREWPRGVQRRRPDADSGPIALGLGTAASAFGLASARLESEEDFERLARTGRLARVLGLAGPNLSDLGDAIWGFAMTATPW